MQDAWTKPEIRSCLGILLVICFFSLSFPPQSRGLGGSTIRFPEVLISCSPIRQRAVILQLMPIDLMAVGDRDRLPSAHDRQIVGDQNRMLVEEHVTVRTEAEHVLHRVWAVVRPSKRPDVATLCIGSHRRLQPSAADLTSVAVETLDLVADLSAANHSTRRDLGAAR